jgi:hypothetical protein
MTDVPAATSPKAGVLPANGFLSLLRQGNLAHGIYWVLIAADLAVYFIVHLLRPDVIPTNLLAGGLLVFAGSLPIMFICLVMLRLYHVAHNIRPERPALVLLKDLKDFLLHPQRMANGLPMLLIMVIFGLVFADVQGKILTLNPSTWDSYFANMDRVLHFGYQPWQLLQPALGYGPITFLININYSVWYLVMWMFFMFFGFASEQSVLRTRFFLCFMATWTIGGGVLATVFSSAGPCYYSRLGLTPDPYTDLMAYLRNVNETLPVWAIGIQDALWEGHLSRTPLSEISAMPSMHNSSALLFALVGFQVNRFWGWALTVHAALIFIGSIHLAWHYAVDSYFVWGLTLVIWFAMAPVSRWWHHSPAQEEFDRMLAAGT